MYALIAYGFQLTYATSKSLNFGQGELVMVSSFVSLTLLNTGLPYVVVVPLGILFGQFEEILKQTWIILQKLVPIRL